MNGIVVLVVNADDLGLSPGVNHGILRAHRGGIVTSASLMVRGDAAREAAAMLRDAPRLAVGLHVDLCEWEFTGGEWRRRYAVADVSDAGAVAAEVRRQLARFRDLVGRDPTHLDSHQHVHRAEPVRSVLRGMASELGVVLRGESPTVRYRGDFYGQGSRGDPCHDRVGVDALRAFLGSLGPGITEMGCHPGEPADAPSVYREERALEVAALCDPAVREDVARLGIRLAAFAPAMAGVIAA